MADSRVIVALDFADAASALDLVDQLDPQRCKLKVGKELFTRAGPEFVRNLVKRDYDVFLDLKFHDIPHTVARACTAAAELGVWMLNVHALGGRAMMSAAREAIARSAHSPYLIAVTVLTSMDESALQEVGINDSPADAVKRLAGLAKDCGLNGVVSSAQEVELVKQQCGDEFVTVTPGIRLPTDDAGDQSRIMTPGRAVQIGADYLVVGRPVTQAADPMAALERIEHDIVAAPLIDT